MQFLDQFLSSGVRTENPAEAHLFFIPALTYAFTANLGDPETHIIRVVDYVRSNYPFFDRSGGRDHFVWTPGDRASCMLRTPEVRALIKLTHFGYFDHWKGVGATEMVIKDARINGEWGCYHPLRDVVMPPYVIEGAGWVNATYHSGKKSKIRGDRPNLFFFAGDLRYGDAEYSGGTRQAVGHWHAQWNDSAMVLVEGSIDTYNQSLWRSQYCLAPYGHGWGVRASQAMLTGCIPVIIQEHVFQPLEEVLPYEEFSLRLNNADIERLPELLRSISAERLAALRKGVETYWPAFVWEPEVGGRAFDYAVLALRRRYMRFKAMYYGRHAPETFRRRLSGDMGGHIGVGSGESIPDAELFWP